MSFYDPHGIYRPERNRRTRHRGQVIQSRLTDPPVTIEQRLVPIYRDYFLRNGILASPVSELPIKLTFMSFIITNVSEVVFSFDDIINSWDQRPMTLSGNYWHVDASQPLYSFYLVFVPLETHFVFYVSGTIGDSSVVSNVPVDFRLLHDLSTDPPIAYIKSIASTPSSTSPYYGYLNFLLPGSTYLTLSGRQFYYVDNTAVGRRVFYPPPQFLPHTIFSI